MDFRLSILRVATAVLITVLSCTSADAAARRAPSKREIRDVVVHEVRGINERQIAEARERFNATAEALSEGRRLTPTDLSVPISPSERVKLESPPEPPYGTLSLSLAEVLVKKHDDHFTNPYRREQLNELASEHSSGTVTEFSDQDYTEYLRAKGEPEDNIKRYVDAFDHTHGMLLISLKPGALLGRYANEGSELGAWWFPSTTAPSPSDLALPPKNRMSRLIFAQVIEDLGEVEAVIGYCAPQEYGELFLKGGGLQIKLQVCPEKYLKIRKIIEANRETRVPSGYLVRFVSTELQVAPDLVLTLTSPNPRKLIWDSIGTIGYETTVIWISASPLGIDR